LSDGGALRQPVTLLFRALPGMPAAETYDNRPLLGAALSGFLLTSYQYPFLYRRADYLYQLFVILVSYDLFSIKTND
jgi:hypothetical protein